MSKRCRLSLWLVGAIALLVPALLLPQAHMSSGQGGKKFKGKQEKKEDDKPPAQAMLPGDAAKLMNWHCIGPANMGGRITAIAVYEADPSIYYLATASGGLLKTTNNGISFEHQFDKETTVSIGDVAVSQSNPNIVWIGTGENNPRNSVTYGDGVYKSTDGGKSWKNMGLGGTFQIGRIAIHPTKPDVVYVGALGRLYGPSTEHGLYKTTDGGKTWERIFFLDENTGILEVKMHPTDPDTLMIAAWERGRDGFDSFLGSSEPKGYDVYDPVKKWGPRAGIYKTTDGGKTFNKMTAGLPTSQLGRICIDYYRKDPKVLFAIVDCEKIGMGPAPPKAAAQPYLGVFGEDAAPGAKVTDLVDGGPAAKADLQQGDIIRSIDKTDIKDYEHLLATVGSMKPGDKVVLAVLRDQQARKINVTLGERPQPKGGIGGGFGGPGGTKPDRPYHAYYGGQRENVQDQQGPNGFEYGGVYRSGDGGTTWVRINSINPRPMYFSQVRVDPSNEQYLYVAGVQLHRSKDGGKKFTPDGGRGVHADHHALWINPNNGKHILVGSDGGTYVTYDRMDTWDHLNHMALAQFYHVAVCNKKPYYVYGGLQDNGSWGGPSIGLKGRGPINEDWISISGGDGFVCRVDPFDPDLIYYESQNGAMGRRHLRTGERAGIRPVPTGKGPSHRFNWNTPFILSNHNPKIFYCAGEYVWRSVDRGNNLKAISPEITRTKRGSATALAESPRNPDVLWVGTDDGALWVTRDGGKAWAQLTLPKTAWIATIEPSRFKEGRAYVCVDAHRSDDDNPWIFMTDDFGKTWTSLAANLPYGSTRCLREDVTNPNVLYLGTEFSVFASIDRGQSWARINNNLPTVAVHEIAVHPTTGEIVAATHGRSIWILDVTALRQTTPDTLKARSHLYKPNTVVKWRLEPSMGGTNRRFVGTNPAPGAAIHYSLADKAESVMVKIVDIEGNTVRTMTGAKSPGFHRVTWDLARTPKDDGKGGGVFGGGGKFGGKGGGKGGGAFGGFRPTVPAGTYRVLLNVDGLETSQVIRVEADPTIPATGAGEDEDEEAAPAEDRRRAG